MSVGSSSTPLGKVRGLGSAQHAGYARAAAEYYLDTRLRSSAEEQQKYCKPLTAS